MRHYFSLTVAVLLLIIFSPVANAQEKAILGVSTTTAQINFPAISSGPGFVLPTSPLYFLDKTKQAVKLFIAVTPEKRAATRMEIAGERMAELRIMFAKNNANGIRVVLNELANEFNAAGDELKDAKSRGKNVEKLAIEIGDSLRLNRKVLDQIEIQSSGELRLRIQTAQSALANAKNQSDLALSLDLKDIEKTEDIKRNLTRGIEEAMLVANSIEENISQFEREVLGVQSGVPIIVAKDAVGQVLGTSTSPIETAREATSTLRDAIDKTEQALQSLGVN